MSARLLSIALGCLLFAWGEPARAGLRPDVLLLSAYSTNLYGTAFEQPGWMTDALFEFDLDLPADARFYYTGAASVFEQDSDFVTHSHGAGVDYVRLVSDNTALLADVGVWTWINRGFRYYDYTQGELRLNLVDLNRSWRPDPGYIFRYRTYPRAFGYRFLEHTIHATAKRELPAGFSYLLRSELGLRRYWPGDLAAETGTGGDSNQAQLVVSANLGHLSPTGTDLQLKYRWLRALTAGGSDLYDEIDPTNLSSDRFSYQGWRTEISVDRETATGITLGAAAKLEVRDFVSNLALDLEGRPIDGGILRSDSRRNLELRGVRPLTMPAVGGRWELLVKWRYTSVDSNDPFYDASTSLYSAALEVSY